MLSKAYRTLIPRFALSIFGIDDAIIGGLLIGGGAFGSSVYNANAQDLANDKTWERTKILKNQDIFDARNAVQLRANDMKKAGINPMLAAGNPAQGTGGAAPQVVAPKIDTGLQQGLSSALDARRLRKEIEATDSQVNLNAAAEATQKADAKLKETNAKVAETTAKTQAALLPAVQAQAKADEAKAKIDEKAATYDGIMKRVLQAVGGVSDAVSLRRQLLGPPPATGKGRGHESNDKLFERQYNDMIERSGSRGIPVP